MEIPAQPHLKNLQENLSTLSTIMSQLGAIGDINPINTQPLTISKNEKILEQTLSLEVLKTTKFGILHNIFVKIMDIINKTLIPTINNVITDLQTITSKINMNQPLLGLSQMNLNSIQAMQNEMKKQKDLQSYMENKKKMTISNLPADCTNIKELLNNKLPESLGLPFQEHIYTTKKGKKKAKITFPTLELKKKLLGIIRAKKDPELKLSFADFIPRDRRFPEEISNSLGNLLRKDIKKIKNYYVSLSPNGTILHYATQQGLNRKWHSLNILMDGKATEASVQHMIDTLDLNKDEIDKIKEKISSIHEKVTQERSEMDTESDTNKRPRSATNTPIKKAHKRILTEEFEGLISSSPKAKDTSNSSQVNLNDIAEYNDEDL